MFFVGRCCRNGRFVPRYYRHKILNQNPSRFAKDSAIEVLHFTNRSDDVARLGKCENEKITLGMSEFGKVISNFFQRQTNRCSGCLSQQFSADAESSWPHVLCHSFVRKFSELLNLINWFFPLS